MPVRSGSISTGRVDNQTTTAQMSDHGGRDRDEDEEVDYGLLSLLSVADDSESESDFRGYEPKNGSVQANDERFSR